MWKRRNASVIIKETEKLMGRGEGRTKTEMQQAVNEFAEEAKRIYGAKLKEIILYGSCARGDFTTESDIDLIILLDVPDEEINFERRRIYDISDRLDRYYNVVLTPVFQNYEVYRKYMEVSVFFQNVQREGVRIA